MLILFEAGGIGPRIPTIPISVGDSRTFHKGVMAATMDYVMSCAQLGLVDFGFLGAAQIDPYGNLNTTVIGDHASPRVRLPGSGGANDVGSLCHRTITLMRHDTSDARISQRPRGEGGGRPPGRLRPLPGHQPARRHGLR
jgi:acyl CoA:acetate/3-ketoacid CoA transferase beta subunit